MAKKYAFSSWPQYEHKVPIVVDNVGTDYVLYGLNNEYPYYLLNMYKRSGKHNAIINGKAQYVFGKGWEAKDGLTTLQQALIQKFITDANELEDLNELTEKLVLDLEIFNGFAIGVTWAKGGEKIARLEHYPIEKVRVDNKEQMFQVADWYDEKGLRTYPSIKDIERIPAFDPSNRKGKQLLYYRAYAPGVKYYPIPNYIGGLAWIEADVEVANFHISNLKNGFVGGVMLNFNNGIPTDEEQLEIERAVKRKFTGTDKAGNIIVNFNDDPTNAPTILTLTPSDLDKQYDILNKTIQQEIFVAHNVVSPALFGIKTEGQLGQQKELAIAYDLFKKNYVNERQQRIERIINYLASFNDVHGLSLIPSEPITEPLSEAALLSVATPNEIREMVGLPPLDELMPAGEAAAPEDEQTAVEANENIKKLSGREYQNLQRIIREYNKGKLNADQARSLMKSGFGLNDGEVDTLLGLNEMQFASEDDDNGEMLHQVGMLFGADESEYTVLSAVPMRFTSDEALVESERMMFAVDEENKELDDKIKKYRKGNPRATVEQIANALDVSEAAVARRIQYLISKDDYPIKRTIADKTKDAPTTEPILEVRYKYDWAPEFKGRVSKDTSRKFCQVMMELAGAGRIYTREDINQISAIMGYSVWARRGGWYTLPNTDVHRPQCRHVWQQQLVMRKGNKIERVEE